MGMQKANADIRGFFQKKQAHSSPPASSPPPPSFLLSSPATPQRTVVKPPLSRDDEIRASDEDDDSDGSLESLTDIGRRNAPSPYQKTSNATATTPKAKRVARGPLPPQTKQKHKFDLKSLVNHARQDDATHDNAVRAQELLDRESDMNLLKDKDTDADFEATLVRETARAILRPDGEDSKGDKVFRALTRTTQGDESRRRHHHFFGPPPNKPRPSFPAVAATGRWAFLADSSRRQHELAGGIPYVLVQKGKELPEELFLWVLDEICIERNLQLRMQYMLLASNCRRRIQSLVDGPRISRMLEFLGGPKNSHECRPQELSSGPTQPPSDRDWSLLVLLLQTLALMFEFMAPKNLVSALQILLRMSLDPAVSSVAEVRVEHAAAVEALVDFFPASEEQWDSCCRETCSYMYTSFTETAQRHIAVRLIPISSPRLCQLRRRLAAEALFADPDPGPQGSGSKQHHRPSQATLGLDDLFARLGDGDFQVTHSTDFEKLNALIAFLDIVIDDGQELRDHRRRTDTKYGVAGVDADAGAGAGAHNDDDDIFDAGVDRLAMKLKAIHDKITDNNHVLKKEAKAVLDSVGKRLTYSVRTRPPPKISIFGKEPAEDVGIPKQREFMKNWAQRQAGRKV